MVVSSLFGQHYSQKTPGHLLEVKDETYPPKPDFSPGSRAKITGTRFGDS